MLEELEVDLSVVPRGDTVGATECDKEYAKDIELAKAQDDEMNAPIMAITGSAGMANARKVIRQANVDDGFRYNYNGNNSENGGAKITAGFNFDEINIEGQKVIFVENPQWNNKEIFPSVLSSGKSRMGSTIFFGDFETNSQGIPNVEIRTRGGNGVDRSFVYGVFDGMTGVQGRKPVTSVDAIQFDMLKENMLVTRNTKKGGILAPPLNA
jgi:hypothetical protein